MKFLIFLQIALGNASSIFNFNNNIDYYFFAVKSVQKNSLILTIKIYNPIINNKTVREYGVNRRTSLDFSLDYKFLYYLMAKGPPLIITCPIL